MFEQILKSLENAFAAKGIRRSLWLFLILTVICVSFEAQTNFFEINAISRQLELLDKAGQPPLTPEQSAKIEKLKSGALENLEAIQAKRANPFHQFLKMAVRFAKGAWVAVPFFWVVIKVAWFFVKRSKDADLHTKGLFVYFGWLGIAAVAWITTILGLNSILWNSSQSIFVSWFVFPVCSFFVLAGVIVWVALLRTLLPKESKQRVSIPETQAMRPEVQRQQDD